MVDMIQTEIKIIFFIKIIEKLRLRKLRYLHDVNNCIKTKIALKM